jgi:repressor LexA
MNLADRVETLHPVARAILALIAEHVAEHGVSPSIRELTEATGVSSTSTVHHHLKTLEREGLIRPRPSRMARAITRIEAVA